MDDDLNRKRKLPLPSQRESDGKNAGSGEKKTFFSLGFTKKSKFDREKEQREMRQKKADEETAKVYESFVASFQQSEAPSFVRPGQNAPPPRAPATVNSTPPPLSNPRFSAPLPPPDSRPHATPQTTKMSKKPPTPFAFSMDDDDEPEQPVVAKRKVREMDRFLEEIKDSAFEPVTTTYDNGADDDSTNLYVNNLAPTVTEAMLRNLFGSFGPIYSVKIMWPRSDEERSRGRNAGFICFCKRLDADNARIHLHETNVEGNEISVMWGKSVKMDPVMLSNAMTAPPPPPRAGPPQVFMRPPPSSLPPPRPLPPGVAPLPQRPSKPLQPPRPQMPPPSIVVEMPEDAELTGLINYVARCAGRDAQFEETMRTSQMDPRYDFLRAGPSSKLYIYFKWKMYSLQMGDTDTSWRTMPFQMVPNGPMWIPPPNPNGEQQDPGQRYQRSPTNNPIIIMTGQQLAAAKDKEKGQRAKYELLRDEYDELCSLLEDVTVDRGAVCELMAFAMDHSECAVDISSVILRSFRIDYASDGTTIQPYLAYVAKLFVISDILHNSSAPLKNASLYRTQFEESLPEIMETLNVVSRAIVGRMSYTAMKDKVLAVLSAWGQWSLFPPAFLIGLNATFLQKPHEDDARPSADEVRAAMDEETLGLNEERLKRKCRQAGLVATGTKDDMYARLYMLKKFTTVSEPAPVVAPPEVTEDDVDGAPMDEEDIDGVPLDGDDDIDGVPLDDDDDIDGVPLDEDDDIDGAPLDD
ncbi:unnamed protein product [Aphanomyces euteiches]|uniref:Uncharacterized protein n=1 Tax=Aphanomyces euteiches TaxID=100861 RepID=A0A6G0X4B7_9STRA|nr:hypothetical protein Ae201684_008641 [Aphanomyces euteiches]KAH9085902.1 hypothetical protein Ae201684P_005598 [Aphanomyces euteiches]KAH9138816.1 hypothetical protein AeRB84_016890 [Aphanomyces euteiches]